MGKRLFLSCALLAALLAAATTNTSTNQRRFRAPSSRRTGAESETSTEDGEPASADDDLQAERGAIRQVHLHAAAAPVIGRPESDVEVFHHDPSSSRNGQIVGGKNADYRKHPYQLQLAIDGQQLCGAAIISRWWAITAAHCLVDEIGFKVPTRSVTLRAGATYLNKGGRVHTVSNAIIHKRFDNEEYDFDIALLKVKVPFIFDVRVQKISLLPQGQDVAEGTIGIVSGWGNYATDGTSSPVLQNVELPIVSHKKCKASYRKKSLLITDRMLCAGFPKGHRDFCQGDSGGPLVVNGNVVAIVSWNIGCAMPGYPGVFTRMSKFRDWVKNKCGV